MGNNQIAISTPDLSTLQEWKEEAGKHAEALKAVRACKNFAEFQAALPVARSLLRDSEAAVAAVAEAKAIAKVGQEVADAHTSYRIGLTAQYLRWVPKVRNRDLARDLWGADDESIVRREKMVARDRKALGIIAAAKAGRAAAPEGSAISVPSPAAALKMVKHVTNAEVAEMTARAKAGQPIVVPQESTPTMTRVTSIANRVESLLKALENVDTTDTTVEALAAISADLRKAAASVDALAATVTPKD